MPRTEEYLNLYNELEKMVPNAKIGISQYFPFYNFSFYKDERSIGVAIPTPTLLNIQNVYPVRKFHLCAKAGLPAEEGNFLTLSVEHREFEFGKGNLSLFLDMCLQFVSKEDGNRELLLTNPHQWAKEKIAILGNKSTDNQPYPYIAEFYLLHQLKKAGLVHDIRQEYRGPEKGIHDFEMIDFSLEVKSHLHACVEDKPGEVIISSDKQLAQVDNKPLYLVYFAMEDTGELSLKNIIDAFGDDRNIALEKLEKNFKEGDLAWQIPYHLVNEPLVYPITEEFPRITPLKFIGGHTPAGITKLSYHISLANLPCCTLQEFITAKSQGVEPKYIANN